MTADSTSPGAAGREAPAAADVAEASEPPGAPRTLPRWRRVLVTVLVVLGCVLAPLSILGVWVHNTLLETDQWVATMGPLIDDPAVQQAVANRVTTAVIEAADLEKKLADVLPGRAKAIAPVVAGGAQQVVDAATLKIVQSDQFEKLWDTVNRRAHAQVVAVLQGEGTETVDTKNGQVVLHLGPVVEKVAQQLSDRGISLFDDVSGRRVNRDVVIFSSEDLRKAQGLVDLLDQLAYILPVLTLVAFAAAIALSGNRRRTILRASLGVALAVGILLTAFNIGRSLYLDALPGTVSRDAAQAVYDQVLTFLRTSLRTAFVLALVIAIGAWLAGAGGAATRVRSVVRGAISRGGEPGEATSVAIFVGHYRNALRVVVVGLGFVALMVMNHPKPTAVLVIAALVLIGLIVVEILGRSAPADAAPPSDPAAGAGT